MTSGYDSVGGGYEKDEQGRIDGDRDPSAPADMPLFEPGARFRYWDDAMTQFGHVLTRAAGKPLDELFKERIADRIGMTDWKWGTVQSSNGPVLDWAGGVHTSHRAGPLRAPFLKHRQMERRAAHQLALGEASHHGASPLIDSQ